MKKFTISILILLIGFSYSFGLDYQWSLSCSSTPDDFTSAFGPRNKGTQANPEYYHHGGMDLQASMNEPVYAAHEVLELSNQLYSK